MIHTFALLKITVDYFFVSYKVLLESQTREVVVSFNLMVI